MTGVAKERPKDATLTQQVPEGKEKLSFPKAKASSHRLSALDCVMDALDKISGK